jgi:hypothetical protein
MEHNEWIRRKLDGLLRAYIRQTHKHLIWKQVQREIENALKLLPIEAVKLLLMLIEPTAEIESRKRWNTVSIFLEKQNLPVTAVTS